MLRYRVMILRTPEEWQPFEFQADGSSVRSSAQSILCTISNATALISRLRGHVWWIQ